MAETTANEIQNEITTPLVQVLWLEQGVQSLN